MTFAKTEFKEEDRKSVAEAIILFTARTEDPKMDLKSYSYLIAPKLELGIDDEDLLLEIFIKSPLRAELERALERDNGGDAERLVQRIITSEEFIKDIIEQRQTTKELEHARKTITELQSKYREADAARKSLERSAGHKVTIEVVTTVELNLQTKINALIAQLESELPEGFEKHGLPEPPKVVTRIGKLKNWLEKLGEAIDASTTVTEAVKLLIPIIELLLKNLNNIS
jgi:hypothetical protein